MFVVLWLLLGAIVLLIWAGTFVAVCLMGMAQFCERLAPTGGGSSATNRTDRATPPRLSASDVQFLRACGIGAPSNGPAAAESESPEPVAAGDGGRR